MVRSVEKYCDKCVGRHGLKQDLSYWSRHPFPPDDMERKEMVERDMPKPPTLPVGKTDWTL
jgi:hypothetical protein